MSELPIIPNFLEPCIANVFFHKVVLGELVIQPVLAKNCMQKWCCFRVGSIQ